MNAHAPHAGGGGGGGGGGGVARGGDKKREARPANKKSPEKNMSEIDEHILKRFDIKKRLGKGAYGIVWKAVDRRSKETVAIKKIFDAFRNQTDAQRTFREIIFLQAFRNHPNIVKLHSIHRALNNRDIYLGFEYMETDLHCVIKRGHILKDVHRRYIMYQILKATKYIHSGNVIHRDQKPSNVLIDSACRVKLADFGLARSVSALYRGAGAAGGEDEPCLTDYVATRWYRAPEILIASKNYTKGIDMWSLGCILGEMLTGKPLFPGTSTVNQVERIMAALPRPSAEDIASVCSGYGSSLLSEVAREGGGAGGGAGGAALSSLLSCAPRDAADLVQRLLVFRPARRLSAEAALQHEYVRKFHCERSEPALGADVVLPLRDDKQVSVDDYRNKLYSLMARPGPRKNAGSGSKPVAPMAPTKASRSFHEADTRGATRGGKLSSSAGPGQAGGAGGRGRAAVSSERRPDARHLAGERRADWERPDWLESRARGDCGPPPAPRDKRPPAHAGPPSHAAQCAARRSASSFSTLTLGDGGEAAGAAGRGARFGVITASAFMDLRTSMR